MFQKLQISEDEFKGCFSCSIYLAEHEDALMANETVTLGEAVFEKSRKTALAAARKEALATLNTWVEGIAAYEMSTEE